MGHLPQQTFFLLRMFHSPMLEAVHSHLKKFYLLAGIFVPHDVKVLLTYEEKENGKFRGELCFLSYGDRVWNDKWPVLKTLWVNSKSFWRLTAMDFPQSPITKLQKFLHDLSLTLISLIPCNIKLNASSTVSAGKKDKAIEHSTSFNYRLVSVNSQRDKRLAIIFVLLNSRLNKSLDCKRCENNSNIFIPIQSKNSESEIYNFLQFTFAVCILFSRDRLANLGETCSMTINLIADALYSS